MNFLPRFVKGDGAMAEIEKLTRERQSMSEGDCTIINGTWAQHEIELLHYALGYAAGAMVRDKSVPALRANAVALLADEMKRRIAYIPPVKRNPDT